MAAPAVLALKRLGWWWFNDQNRSPGGVGGARGAAGATPYNNFTGGYGGTGGAGGSAVAGNSYVTWVATGTRYGALT